MANKKLTMKQEQFCQEAIKTLNPTEAVRKVYSLGSKGGKNIESTARSIAFENLTKPIIRERFEILLKGIDDEEILSRFQKILREGKDRDALTAGKELLTLKNRYPQNFKSSRENFQAKIEALYEDMGDQER